VAGTDASIGCEDKEFGTKDQLVRRSAPRPYVSIEHRREDPVRPADEVGKAVIHFAEGQALLELRCSFQPIRFDL